MATLIPSETPNAQPSIPNDSTTSTPSLCTPATSNAASVTKRATAKLKRFRFTDKYDMSLLKAVRCVDAHLPEWGKAEALNEEVLKLFLREVQPAVFIHSQKPSAKTVSDRFKRLVALRREQVKSTTVASGIIEKHGDKEVLLDDLIMEMDEKEEATRAEKEQQTENEKLLVAVGENIRVMALKRRKTGLPHDGEVDESTESSAKKRGSRKQESPPSDDDVTASMLKQAAGRREMEEHRLALERERMEMEREKAERESERFELTQQATNSRLDLDDKRFELEKEERKQSLVERKKMFDVMELLYKSGSEADVTNDL